MKVNHPYLDPILTWPMAKLKTFWDYIFSRENKVQTFILGFHSLSEMKVNHPYMDPIQKKYLIRRSLRLPNWSMPQHVH